MNGVSNRLRTFLLGIGVTMLVVFFGGNLAKATVYEAESGYQYVREQLNVTYDGEPLKFVQVNYGVLRLMSRDNLHDYLSFPNYFLPNGGGEYSVKKIRMINPNHTFFEVIASAGAKAQNAGDWLIGKHKGKWVTYISLENLATMGYTINDWHQIKSQVSRDMGIMIYSSHFYYPPGARFGYQLRRANDLIVQAYWDEKAEWFGMRTFYNKPQ